MKKLLFVLAFAFIGQQAFSQMYIVSIQDAQINNCSVNNEHTLSTISPTGVLTKTCIDRGYSTNDPNDGLISIISPSTLTLRYPFFAI